MRRLTYYFFRFLLIGLAVISAAGVYFWHVKGTRYYAVQSGSMAPALKVGDLLVDENIKASDLRPGDIVSYSSLSNPGLIISHRVWKNEAQANLLITKGDNLSNIDPPVAYSQVHGKAVKIIPYVGYGLDALRNPLGLLSLVYVPIIAVGLVEAKKLSTRRTYKHAKLS